MISINSIKKQTLVDYEDILFMFVEEESKFDSGQLYYVDAIIINETDEKLFSIIFNEIRKHYDPEIYLKPVFAVRYTELSQLITACVDGITDLTQYQMIAQRTRMIKERIQHLHLQQKFPSSDFGHFYKTLQYLYTREKSLLPVPNRMSRVNYFFPFLSRLLEDKDNFKVLEILDIALKDGYLMDEKIKDKVHLCDKCDSAHHNIRETCKNCGSIDLKVEDLIHHFQCAYIGPESDFMQEYTDDLICPKCQKLLRHIGVDYDKPSHIYGCNSCSEHFQNPTFTYSCIDCGNINDIRHLKEHLVREYIMTSKGKHLVLNGLPRKVYDTKEEKEEITGIYSFEVFQHILHQERARAGKNNLQSVLGTVTLTDSQFNNLSWREMNTLQTEISKVLKSYLNEHDMVTSNTPGEYYFLLTESSMERAMELKETMLYNLEHLVKSNVADSKVEVEVTLEEVTR